MAKKSIEACVARTSRKKEIKERVLAAALELIVEGGFQQSPMSKLAQLAGVSVGSIYLYFPSKDELIAALFEDVRIQMQDKILTGYNDKLPIQKRFDVLFGNMCSYYLENKRHFIFMDQFGLSSYNKSSLDAFSEQVASTFLNFYNDGVKEEILKPYDLQVTLSLTHGPIISLVKRHHTGFLQATAERLKDLQSGVWCAISL